MTKNAPHGPLAHSPPPQNVGTFDRALRAVASIGLGVFAVFAPWPAWVRLLALGGTSVYLGITALAGTCLGYRLLGRSTCPVQTR